DALRADRRERADGQARPGACGCQDADPVPFRDAAGGRVRQERRRRPMTGEEVRKLKDEEIALEVRRLREKLYTLRTQAVTEKVEDLSQFTKIRRDVARLLTERSARAA